MKKEKTTSENIKKLKENEIFVFGSNDEGNHCGGAAKLALDKFKATQGQSMGIQGQSYAINTMSGIEEIKRQIPIFIDFAKVNKDLTFLVTDVGCGIAGFKVEEIAPLFETAKDINNIHLPQSFWNILNQEVKLITYKGFDKDLKCRDFQYKIGKEYEEKEAKACNKGFHACEYPLDVFNYYSPATSRFAIVEQSGKIDRENSDSKVASTKIKINAEINLFSLIKLGVEKIISKVNFDNKEENTSDNSAATNTGYYSAATNTGNKSAATNTGDYSAATNTGNYSAATNTGNYSAAIVEGNQSIACGFGYKNKAKGVKDCWLVLAEKDNNYNILCVKSVKVDGKQIKENTFYTLENGEFVEVKDK